MALNGRQLGQEMIAAYVRAGKIPEDQADNPDVVESLVIMSEVIVNHIINNAEFNLAGLDVKTTVQGSEFTVDFPAAPGWNPALPTATVGGSADEVSGVVTGDIAIT